MRMNKNIAASATTPDQWAQWLLPRRHVDDPSLYPQRDRVLDNARIGDGDTLLDLGSGDGLIAFGALPRVGPTGKVIFCDTSVRLLEECRRRAEQAGVLDHCEFVHASAEDLTVLPEASVDVVTTRAVLLYMPQKQSALSEIHRILRHGGRLSSVERINCFGWPEPAYIFWGYDVGVIQEIADKVKAYYDHIQPPQINPMLNFDERDLLAFAENAGFREIDLSLEIHIGPIGRVKWDDMIRAEQPPPYTLTTLEEVMSKALTSTEAQIFTDHLRPLAESGDGMSRKATAYLRALKS